MTLDNALESTSEFGFVLERVVKKEICTHEIQEPRDESTNVTTETTINEEIVITEPPTVPSENLNVPLVRESASSDSSLTSINSNNSVQMLKTLKLNEVLSNLVDIHGIDVVKERLTQVVDDVSVGDKPETHAKSKNCESSSNTRRTSTDEPIPKQKRKATDVITASDNGDASDSEQNEQQSNNESNTDLHCPMSKKDEADYDELKKCLEGQVEELVSKDIEEELSATITASKSLIDEINSILDKIDTDFTNDDFGTPNRK